MNGRRLSHAVATALGAEFPFVAQVLAVPMVSIDLDLVAPGVQSSFIASPGDVVAAALVIEAGADGVSAYGVSVQYDPVGLDLADASVTEFLPAGFQFNLTPGMSGIDEAGGWIRTFEAVTLASGPSSAPFVAGTMSFQYLTAMATTISAGFFNLGVDGMFDNSGNPLEAAFVPARIDPRVTPEPSALLLISAALAGLALVSWRSAGKRRS